MTTARRWPRWFTVVVLLSLATATVACGGDDTITAAESSGGPATVMLAVDISLSMLAEDIEPNRFDGTHDALDTFLDEAPPEIYVGLVSFHGIAKVHVAPTTDRAELRSALANLRLDEATAIGEAIFASIESLDSFVATEGDVRPGRIVVLSDGETTVGRPDWAAIEAAQEAGYTVSTIAVGTEDGVMRVPDSEIPIPVPTNGTSLAVIANETGGEFFEGTTTAALVEALTSVAQGLDR